MESTKSTQSITTKEETEEHNLEQLINLLKRVKVTSSFVEKLEKEPGYLEFQQEVDLKWQELLKSKQAVKKEQIHSVEVEREKPQTQEEQEDSNVPPELNVLHQILEQYKVVMPIKEMAEQSPCCVMFHTRMKHLAIDRHFVRDLVAKKELQVSHVPSSHTCSRNHFHGVSMSFSPPRLASLKSPPSCRGVKE